MVVDAQALGVVLGEAPIELLSISDGVAAAQGVTRATGADGEVFVGLAVAIVVSLIAHVFLGQDLAYAGGPLPALARALAASAQPYPFLSRDSLEAGFLCAFLARATREIALCTIGFVDARVRIVDVVAARAVDTETITIKIDALWCLCVVLATSSAVARGSLVGACLGEGETETQEEGGLGRARGLVR